MSEIPGSQTDQTQYVSTLNVNSMITETINFQNNIFSNLIYPTSSYQASNEEYALTLFNSYNILTTTSNYGSGISYTTVINTFINRSILNTCTDIYPNVSSIISESIIEPYVGYSFNTYVTNTKIESTTSVNMLVIDFNSTGINVSSQNTFANVLTNETIHIYSIFTDVTPGLEKINVFYSINLNFLDISTSNSLQNSYIRFNKGLKINETFLDNQIIYNVNETSGFTYTKQQLQNGIINRTIPTGSSAVVDTLPDPSILYFDTIQNNDSYIFTIMNYTGFSLTINFGSIVYFNNLFTNWTLPNLTSITFVIYYNSESNIFFINTLRRTPITTSQNLIFNNYSITNNESKNFNSISWSTSTGIIVGSNTNILKTTDFITWSNTNIVTTALIFNSVTFSEDLDLFCAVGPLRSAVSTTGTTWTTHSNTFNLTKVIPGKNNTVDCFYALDTNYILESTSGTSWTTRYNNSYNSIIFSDRFEYVFGIGSVNFIIGKETTWYTYSLPFASDWSNIIYTNGNGSLSSYRILCASSSTNIIYTIVPLTFNPAIDQLTWTTSVSPSGSWTSMAWNDTTKTFIAFSENTNNSYLKSSDGYIWNSYSINSSMVPEVIYVYELSKFVAINNTGNILET